MGNIFQFLQVERKDPAKVESDIRIKEYKEIYEISNQDQIAEQADRCLDCGNPYCE